MKFEIEKYGACKEALLFRAKFETFEQAWNACPRGDWMLWIAMRVDVDFQTLTLAKALCVKTIVHLMKDERSVKAVEVAEAFGRGNASRDDWAAAAADAADAAAASASAAAAYAALAAAYADADDALATNQMQTADICREILTESVMQLINKEP